MRGPGSALVGESGCGKSTTGYGILGFAPVTDGEVRFEGKILNSMTPKALHDLVSSEMQLPKANRFTPCFEFAEKIA